MDETMTQFSEASVLSERILETNIRVDPRGPGRDFTVLVTTAFSHIETSMDRDRGALALFCTMTVSAEVAVQDDLEPKPMTASVTVCVGVGCGCDEYSDERRDMLLAEACMVGFTLANSHILSVTSLSPMGPLMIPVVDKEALLAMALKSISEQETP